MHVLVLPSFYPNEADPISGSFVREQALALGSKGITTGVVAAQLRSLRQIASPKSKDRGWHEDGPLTCLHACNIGIPGKLLSVRARQYRRLAQRLCTSYIDKQGKPDVLHAHDVFNAGIFTADYGRKNGIATVLTLHSSGWLRSPNSAAIEHLKHALNGVDTVIAVSPALAQAVADLSGTPIERIKVVGNLISSEHPGVSSGKTPARRWVSVGALAPNKGHLELVRAFAKAFGGGEETSLRIIGEGPQRPIIQAEIERLGLHRCVTLDGALPRKAVFDALSDADAFVLATAFETFGLSILEALAAGLPVVSTRCGGPESFVGGDDGRLTRPGDHEELCEALRYVAEQTWDRDAIAARAHERFSAGAVVGQLRSLYGELVAGV